MNLALFVGHNTTSTTIVFALWASELETIVRKDLSENETFEDLQQMEYLDMVLKESNRIYPAAITFGREFDYDEEFSRFKFLKGRTLFPFFYASHRDSEYFPGPEIFDPERFSLRNPSEQNLTAYMPFGLGPRTCVG